MATVTLTIPDDKADMVRDAFWETYPVERDPTTGEPLYTKNQWVKQVLMKKIKHDVNRWKENTAAEAAKNAVVFDDGVVS